MTTNTTTTTTFEEQRQKTSLSLPAGDVEIRKGLVLKKVPSLTKYPALIRAMELTGKVGEYGVWIGPARLNVIASVDETHHGNLLHVSVSYPKMDPGWNIIKAVRYAFYPEWMDVMMVLPAKEDYVNVMGHCFQMWQCPSKWGMQ